MRVFIKVFFTVVLLFAITIVYGQSNKERAYELGMEAIKLMDNGALDASIKLLEEASALDPKNIFYPYEIALAHTKNEDYKRSMKILKKLTKHPDVFDQVYQLYGINYSYSNNRKKAIAMFDAGIKKFPNSGILHLERGNMELFIQEYNNALFYYEKGIQVDPRFPSNYYWASKIFCSSSEEVWGMIYGEIFMNLERNSRRTEEISKMLYETYKSEINFVSDSSFTVSFSKVATVNINKLDDLESFKLPFGVGAYEPTLLLSVINEKQIDIYSLNRIRKNFIDIYFSNEVSKTYPNVLFDYKKRIMDLGHLEAYNFWILMKGDEDAFDLWHYDNEEKWRAFVDWFTDNPIEIDSDNKFHRLQY